MARPKRSAVRDRADDGLLTLVGDVPQLVKNLISAEVDKAKGWVTAVIKNAGIGTGLFVVALFFVFWAIPVFLGFLVALLSLWLPVWASALIVFGIGLVLAIIAGGIGLVHYLKIKKLQNPLQAAKTDTAIVKEVADEF